MFYKHEASMMVDDSLLLSFQTLEDNPCKSKKKGDAHTRDATHIGSRPPNPHQRGSCSVSYASDFCSCLLGYWW